MILCVTPNAAIDRTLVVPNLRPGVVARPTEVIVAAGGKGFNVARAVQQLGGQTACAGFLGGHMGRLVDTLAREEGLTGHWTWREVETRMCSIIIDESRGAPFEIYEAGTPINLADWSRLVDDVVQAAQNADVVCMSGSLPPGCPPEAPADLIEAVQATGKPVWVDTSGPALSIALTARPAGLKINMSEAAELLGGNIDNPQKTVQAAQVLVGQGVDTAVISMGKAGAVLASPQGCWQVTLPTLSSVSAVGSGDSFLAGLLVALGADLPVSEALRRAAAVGAANTLAPGGARFRLSDVEAILAKTAIIAFSDG